MVLGIHTLTSMNKCIAGYQAASNSGVQSDDVRKVKKNNL